jgi:hypothetical protein
VLIHLYHLFAVLDDATQIEFSLIVLGYETIVEGAITVQPLVRHLDGFDTYFKSLRPDTNIRNPWFSEYWQDFFKQVSILNTVTDMLLIGRFQSLLDAGSSWSNYPGASCPVSTVIHVSLDFISPTSVSLRSSSCNLFVTQSTPTLTPYTTSGKLNAKVVPASARKCETPKAAFSNTT